VEKRRRGVMIILWIVFGVFLAAALVGLIAFRSSRRSAAPRTGSPLTVSASRVAAVTLEVDEADAASPAVQRLVHETALGIFRTAPDAREVEVRSRAGTILGRVSRETPPPRELRVSPVLHEPHVRRTHVPDVLGGLYGSEPAPRPDRDRHTPDELAPPHRSLMDQFDLPEVVRAGIVDPDDPIDLVRAILEAAGVPCEIDGDLIRVGEAALVILHASGDVVIGHGALNHAYLRVVRSGAQRGLVIAVGFLDPREVKRREMLAPQVLHAGPDGIQRMADAVSLGADPLRFTVAIPVSPGRTGGHNASDSVPRGGEHVYGRGSRNGDHE
jgi:hypothetical protein